MSGAGKKKGSLTLVAVPIGNSGDFSPRASEIIASADLLICEEKKEAGKILKLVGQKRDDLYCINEHNESGVTSEIVAEIKNGRNAVLFSDCGTPAIADPGSLLVQMAHDAGINVSTVPGPCSITAAVSVSGFNSERFRYYGFLSRNSQERRRELKLILASGETTVILEAPYRLQPLLDDMASVFSKGRRLCIASNLTLPSEKIKRGTAVELKKAFGSVKSSEFVIVVESSDKVSGGKQKSGSRRQWREHAQEIKKRR